MLELFNKTLNVITTNPELITLAILIAVFLALFLTSCTFIFFMPIWIMSIDSNQKMRKDIITLLKLYSLTSLVSYVLHLWSPEFTNSFFNSLMNQTYWGELLIVSVISYSGLGLLKFYKPKKKG